VSLVTVVALIAPLVNPSNAFKALAATVVSVSVTAGLLNPVIPADPSAVATADAAPESVVTDVGSIAPLV
jgi:hypothetical protein